LECALLWVKNLNIFVVAGLFEKKNLTDICANDELAVRHPGVAHEVCGNRVRLAFFSPGETLMGAL